MGRLAAALLGRLATVCGILGVESHLQLKREAAGAKDEQGCDFNQIKKRKFDSFSNQIYLLLLL